MSELDALVDRRPMILKLAESQSGIARKNLYTPAWSLGIPQKDSKNYKEAMAMDACCRNVLSGALKNDVALSAFPLFVGYGFLSNLAQEGLIRAGVETIADDMTRKPIELYYDDEGGEEEEDKITKLKAEMVKYKVRERMNTAMLKDGYFGGCLVYIDVGELEDDEAELPLVLDEKTFKKGSLRGFKVIEPVNIAPGTYNTTDPTADDYFNPNWYYILGRKFHKSRFLYIASNETPLLLKAAYNFFGIPQAQLALDYVAHFVANRESAQELLNKFSLTCFGTDMSQGLQANGSWSDLVKRMKMFNKMKNNNGTFVYNKETEELSQINTPLSGVREIVEMSLNLLTAIWRIPKIRYIGEGEGGLNASSVEQMRSYYDYINAMQEKVLTVPYETILKILQLNLGMIPDEKLMFKFPVLWDMDEQERANLNKIKADTMATYLSNGIISQEEARRSLSMDRNSGFTMIDAEDVPEPVEEPLKDVDKEEQDEEDKQAMDEKWITVKPHGDDEKGVHVLLEGFGEEQETPKEAIERKFGKKKRLSLLSFLIKHGGIKDTHGELKILDARKGRVGLINNKGGMDLDRARELAEQHGYIGIKKGQEETDVNTLLEAIDGELRGKKVYADFDESDFDEYDEGEQEDYIDKKLSEVGVDTDGMTFKEKKKKFLDLGAVVAKTKEWSGGNPFEFAMDSIRKIVNAFDAWVESKHPRDRMGRFAEKSGGSSSIDYKKGSDESFSDYALRFDQTDVDSQSVLNGLRSYVSEAGKTHQPKEMEKAIFDVEKKIAEGEETVDKYRVSGRRDSAVYTPEREKLHEKIVEELLAGKKQSDNPTFILLGGRGGSGKSKFNGEVYDKKDFVVLDADKIKEMLPEYEGWNAAHLHEESADVLERALTTAKKLGLNVVLDATMNGLNTTKRRLDLFKNSGYHTEMHYMFLPRQKAASRAITRFVDKPKGRYVPIDKILNMRDNEKNFQELTKYVDAYSFSNNDVPFGSMPKLVEKKGDFYYKNGGKKWI